MNSKVHQIHQALVTQWESVYECAEDLDNGVMVKPKDGWTVLAPVYNADPAEASFEITPVLFVVPEVKGEPNSDLYVVLKGLITMDANAFTPNGELKMIHFGSRVAYFRQTAEGFEHLFGAHYDVSLDEVGHPAFHMQIDSYAELLGIISAEFGSEQTLTADHMKGVPKRIRIPSAQLDTFTVAIQIIADHLIDTTSSQTDLSKFNSLIAKARKLQGVGRLIPRLHTPSVYECYRGIHWYPQQ
jgi:hypothetical protein